MSKRLLPILLILALTGCTTSNSSSNFSFSQSDPQTSESESSSVDELTSETSQASESEFSTEDKSTSEDSSIPFGEDSSSDGDPSSSDDEEVPPPDEMPPEDVVDYNKILVNELCSKTRSCFLDKYEEESDWIELYNSDSKDISLLGCGLSNKAKNKYLFTFDDYTLKAHEYLVVAASERSVMKYKGEYHLPFSLSQPKGGTIIFSSPTEVISEVTYPILRDDISYGLIDGDYTTLQPSPGHNNETVYIEKQTLEAPTFSAPSGMYDDEFDLDISGPEGTTIYYTLDCSTPNTSSSVFENSIRVVDPSSNPNVIASKEDICGPVTPYVPDSPVNKCFVVRAIAYDEEGNHSPVVSSSYWIDQSSFLNDKIALTSICTDYDNLFGYENGIYCNGKAYDDWVNSSEYDSSMLYTMQPANYHQKGFEWERQANLSLVEKNKVKCEQTIGLRVKGNSTRGLAKKSFNLYSRILYDGNNKFTYKFNGMKCKKITLRSGGNFINYPIGDVLNSGLAKKYNLNLETQENKATYLFLNGEFWGLYFYCDVFDDEYFSNKYDADDPIVYKDTDIEEGFKTDISFFRDMRHLLANDTLSEEDYFSQISQIINVPSIVDTLLAHLIIGVGDFRIVSCNSGCWIDRGEIKGSNKVKFLLYDTDWFNEDIDTLFEDYRESLPVFFSNPYLLGKMYARAVELKNLFSSSETTEYINDYYDSLDTAINQNNMRFYGCEDAGQASMLSQHISCYQNRPDLVIDKIVALLENSI